MTTTADAFLADILAEPDDDALRLIYADWMDDHGETERAEFIRVQCEVARREALSIPLHKGSHPVEDIVFAPRPGLNPEHAENERRKRALRRRERELWARAADDAMQIDEPLWGLLPDWSITGHSPNGLHLVHRRLEESQPDLRLTFRRGFVEAITLSADDWMRHADALTAAAPIRAATLTTEPDWLSARRSGRDDPREYFLLCGPQRRARRWSYEQLRLHLHDDGRPNAATSGGPWRRHVAARLLAAEWPRVTFRLPS